jgi:hypothetical protein
MATMLKKFNSYSTPSSTNVLNSYPTTPAMQTIVVDGVPVVDPQFASVIGN